MIICRYIYISYPEHIQKKYEQTWLPVPDKQNKRYIDIL